MKTPTLNAPITSLSVAASAMAGHLSLLTVLLALVLFALCPPPKAFGVVPAPDGGYPGGNTAEGQNALLSLTTGDYNAGIGFVSLGSNTTGSLNTAIGAAALLLNNGNENTATGFGALLSNTTGPGNTANGAYALFRNTIGNGNTATGDDALYSNTEGNANTAMGIGALLNNTTGDANVAIGPFALADNTLGNSNVAIGFNALSNNTADQNTAVGFHALLSNTTGFGNTATGAFALSDNTIGPWNTANGNGALSSNTDGSGNTAMGFYALYSNTTGDDNTAIGRNALSIITTTNGNTAVGSDTLIATTGDANTALGARALRIAGFAGGNTAIGYEALLSNTTGVNNIALGFQAGANLTSGSSNIDIGNVGFAGEANTIRIGTQGTQTAAHIAGIFNQTSSSGTTVFVNSDGKLGTNTSSRRFKEDIKPLGRASEAILALKPVTFRYTKKIDPAGIQQFGLVAEDVERVNPDLVVRDKDGKPYTVRYDQVNAMLLNEFLKEHEKVGEQGQTIKQLKSAVAEQRKNFESKLAQQEDQIAALTSGLQKVSAHIEVNKPALHMVLNNQ